MADYNEIMQYFSERYGTDLQERIKKLIEEAEDLRIAFLVDYMIHESKTKENLLDEASGVLVIISHICHLLGVNIEEMLNKAYDKSKIREKDPNYKR